MVNELSCWKCGAELKDVIFPMSRREECAQCGADQHVCRMCKEFDGRGGCNEPRAEQVSDTERANFCDYFAPSGKVFAVTGKQEALDAKAQLAALFGEEPTESNESQLKEEQKLTPAQIAEKKLRDMLGD